MTIYKLGEQERPIQTSATKSWCVCLWVLMTVIIKLVKKRTIIQTQGNFLSFFHQKVSAGTLMLILDFPNLPVTVVQCTMTQNAKSHYQYKRSIFIGYMGFLFCFLFFLASYWLNWKFVHSFILFCVLCLSSFWNSGRSQNGGKIVKNWPSDFKP